MSPPQHVKVISLATNAAVLLMGARNVFATGTALPIPGDDKFLAHFGGSSPTAFLFQLFGLFMIAWGPCPIDPCAGVECDDGDDCTVDYCVAGSCTHAQPEECGGFCGATGAGPCDQINATPGCDDRECCLEICETDPYCCIVVWDVVCRNKATSGDYPGCQD